MRDHIVEIEREGNHVSLYRGFLIISSHGIEHGRVPLDDLQAVICSARGTSITTPVLAELAQRGIPVIISGEKYLPQAVVWPLDANHQTARRIRMQIAAPIPLRKRLWKKIVQLKLQAQASVLTAQGYERGGTQIRKLIRKVLSGDRSQVEAVAAKFYWKTLFNSHFTRKDSQQFPINKFLNYGYAIIRSSVARAVAATGLHPAIGLFHHNRFNPFCLVDDVMEPFRPIVDQMVFHLFRHDKDLSITAKKSLASILRMDMKTEEGHTPLSLWIQKFATSLALSFEENKLLLRAPISSLPIDLQGTKCSADIE